VDVARYDAEWIASMLSAERARETDPFGLLRWAGLLAGGTVVDYGAGPGFFTLPAAEVVGSSGQVVAVDLEPRMRDEVARRAQLLGCQNIEVLDPEGAKRLPAGVASLVIAALLLHDLSAEERKAVLPELRRLCAPDGRLLVVEWVAPGGLEGPSTHNRFAAADLTALLRRHGFRPGRPQHLGAKYFALTARRNVDGRSGA
jgi:ubiquinone/menaquinone biosynthesis C-methylase UbiE